MCLWRRRSLRFARHRDGVQRVGRNYYKELTAEPTHPVDMEASLRDFVEAVDYEELRRVIAATVQEVRKEITKEELIEVLVGKSAYSGRSRRLVAL